MDDVARSVTADRLPTRPLVACSVAAALTLTGAATVVVLRAANTGSEPVGQNWWLVTWIVVSVAYSVAGTALLTRADRRLLGAGFVVIGVAAIVTALAVQGRATEYAPSLPHWSTSADDWSSTLLGGVLVALVPWLLLPGGWRRRRSVQVAAGASALGVGVLVTADALDGPRVLEDSTMWLLSLSATAAAALHAQRWWLARHSGDPLPGWLLAGVLASWLSTVPAGVDLVDWRLPGRDVVRALLLVATVPLLVGGAVVDAIREIPSRYHGVSHRVAEWTILAAGITVVYTVTVAGLGRLVGGSAPTWFLVVSTGLIALVLEPARHGVRRLVDRLVYGTRDDPLVVVQRVVDHLGADAGDELLPRLVESLQHELRLDAVAIDLRLTDGWQRAAATGPPTAHHRVIFLDHGGAVVGRLVVGWEHGPALRQRDEEVLTQLVGPLSLAVGWVRLAADLRRSSLAIVSAREEERRRLRRDLHDGLGPALTGVSLGLRTAVRQLDRSVDTLGTATPRLLVVRVADEVDSLVGELKRIVRDLRPTALDQLGLAGAVAAFTRTFTDDLEIHLVLPPTPVELPAAVEVATYRIVTEAVTNVVRHARAASCWLTIATGPTVEIDVVDDGVGLDETSTPGVGLTTMRERAAELGGTLRLLPHSPRGTHLHVRLPAALP